MTGISRMLFNDVLRMHRKTSVWRQVEAWKELKTRDSTLLQNSVIKQWNDREILKFSKFYLLALVGWGWGEKSILEFQNLESTSDEDLSQSIVRVASKILFTQISSCSLKCCIFWLSFQSNTSTLGLLSNTTSYDKSPFCLL